MEILSSVDQYFHASATYFNEAVELSSKDHVILCSAIQGNPELYVSRGAPPTFGSAQYQRAYFQPSLVISSPQPGPWFIGIYARKAEFTTTHPFSLSIDGLQQIEYSYGLTLHRILSNGVQ